VVNVVLPCIEQLNPTLNAFCLITPDAARQAAQTAEQAVMRGDTLGPLHGVPLSIKDLVMTKGMRTMRGSKLYEHDVPTEEALSSSASRRQAPLSWGRPRRPNSASKVSPTAW
jgi:Asp-tRNA(Asn)/Glu-tRNA(Gln) amidotransferase A subunit family amidase